MTEPNDNQRPNPGLVSQRPASQWSPADAARLYGIEDWGLGYFGVNDAGHVTVRPTGGDGPELDVKELIDQLQQRDLKPPLLLRFSDVLKHRLAALSRAFNRAMAELEYGGRYRCVYPIKVNQQRHVLEEILQYGSEHGFGVEVGSKPELLAVLALVDDPQTPIICNGFKDDQFIEAVILANKLGKNVTPVVEKFSELELIIKYAQRHNVRPRVGVRAKLATRGAGQWEQSGGEHSKFGLYVSEILAAVERLRGQNMLDCLNLLHFHLGSQVNHIGAIKAAINEQARIYAELYHAGAGLEYIDVGGGLGVDYEGAKTNIGASINYSLQEYANDVIFHVREVCNDAGVPHPTILSESGRAVVAYHSLLVFGVVGWSGFDRFELPDGDKTLRHGQVVKPVQTLHETYHALSEHNFIECYHDAQLARDEALHLFNLGYASLADRAWAERLFLAICGRVMRLTRDLPHVPEEFQGLETLLSDTYFCNCSIFQSLPDVWAIDQVFPIMPLHRLDEKPTARGVLADITCDSDGAIDRFINQGQRDREPVLELHPYDGGQYFLGAFLVVDYQEILGDLHNLFGDTNAVHVSIDQHGQPSIDEIVQGDSVSDVLRYVQFEPGQLRRAFRQSVEKAVGQSKLTIEESRLLRRFYEQGLTGYTYLT